MSPMRALRLLGIALYAGYLVHVGLLMLLLPWSGLWPDLLVRMPFSAAMALDLPAVRGAISAFGALHLAMVVAELVVAPPHR